MQLNNFTIISCQPSDPIFLFQIRVQLYNFRQLDYSKYYRILVFIPNDRLNESLDGWKKLEEDYPEAKFFYYFDTENFLQTTKNFNYIPLIRPYCLAKHWDEFPFLEQNRILYLDSDVLILKELPLDTLKDNINYLSDTKSYNGSSYFLSKVKDVKPIKLESYKKIDVLQELGELIGISKETIIENENCTGGAQYILQGIDKQFWIDVLTGCIMLKNKLAYYNQVYFPSENAGMQSFCADMWSVLWNLWKRGKITETPSFMDFCWSTDPIEKWDNMYIYHDAGAVGNPELFNKRKASYIAPNTTSSPFDDDLSFVSPKYCSFNYVKAIQQSKP